MIRFLSPQQLQDRIREHTPARCARMDRYVRFVERRQYEGRPDWFDDSVELFRRAPALKSPVVEGAISSHIGMIFKKCPVFTTAPDEDESLIDPTFGLDEETSKTLDAGLAQLVKHASLFSVFKKQLRDAMSAGSVVVIVGVREGRFFADVQNAAWCTPTFSPTDSKKLESIEILYPYVQPVQNPITLQWGNQIFLYRRVVDAISDVTYYPVEAPERRTDPIAWREDPDKRRDHGLGFCPVRWYPFMGRCSATEADGEPIHARLLGEIMGLDFTISQRHRAVLYASDPVTIETGVEEGYVPTEVVRGATAYMGDGYDEHGVRISDDPGNKAWRQPGQAQRARRKRGPGQVWQYTNPESKADFLTLPADAITAGMTNAQEIERMVCEALHWIPLDPETRKQSSATMSGRALEWLHKKQVDYDDDVRGDFAENAMLPVVDMLLRLIVIFARRKQPLYLPGFQKMADILERFEHKSETQPAGAIGPATTWVTPRMSVIWPDYFEASEIEQKSIADTALALKDAGALKLATVVKRVAPYFDIDNPAQYAEDLEAEAEEKAKKTAAAFHALQPQSPPGQVPAEQEPTGEAPQEGPPRSVPKAKPPREPMTPKPKKPPVVRKARAAKTAQPTAA